MTTILLAALLLTTTTLKPSYTKEEIRQEYSKIVKQNALPEGRNFGRFSLDTTGSHALTEFAKENAMLLQYLLMNYEQVAYEYQKRMKQAQRGIDNCCDSSHYSTIMFESLLTLSLSS